MELKSVAFTVGFDTFDELGSTISGTSKGANLAWSTDAQDAVTLMTCEFDGANSRSRGEAVLKDGDVLITTVTISATDYVVSAQRQDFEGMSWTQVVTAQSDFYDDYAKEKASTVLVMTTSSAPSCS